MLEYSRNQDNGAASAQPIGVELPLAIRADLLSLAPWQDGLAKYARATNLAVALADAAGRLIGEYINPRPTWSLLHAKPALTSPSRSPTEVWEPGVAGGVGCPFSLAPLRPCNCVADALARGGFVVTRDRTGLVHFAVPLVLGEHPLGALVAGQVFDQYPEQLPLEHVAKQLGLSPAPVWQVARLEHPVKRATLEVYADLLATLGQTFLQTRYHRTIEAGRLAEMTRLRDRLAEADRRKDEFLAMLGHELRNPLAPIRNALHLVRLGNREPRQQVRQAYDIIERQVENLVRLVDDLLDVGRITSGKIRLQKERIDLAAVVAHAIEGVRPLIDARRHTLEVNIPDVPMPVDADPVRLAQVLWNLLNNAAKYTPDGGRITLTVERGDEAVVRIRDTGMGIAPEMLPKVFDLFTQLEGTLNRAEGGLGLGLTLVRRLTEMHGGTVAATSEGQGQGCEFVVRLPVLLDEAPAAELGKPAAAERRVAPAPGRRILVVDDNRDSAESLEELLRHFGNDVRTVHDGRLALEVAADYRPDVVLLDIGLPGLDGLEVCRRLRARGGGIELLIVAMTGYGQEEDRRRSEEAGFDAHMVKPVDLGALQELLSRPDLVCHGTVG